MRLLNVYTLELEDFTGKTVPPYHILSHRGSNEKISYKEYRKGLRSDSAGHRKIIDFCELIRRHAHLFEDPDSISFESCEWVWIDTCKRKYAAVLDRSAELP